MGSKKSWRAIPIRLGNKMYGVGLDSKLRPIRGDDISETEDAALTVGV